MDDKQGEHQRPATFLGALCVSILLALSFSVVQGVMPRQQQTLACGCNCMNTNTLLAFLRSHCMRTFIHLSRRAVATYLHINRLSTCICTKMCLHAGAKSSWRMSTV